MAKAGLKKKFLADDIEAISKQFQRKTGLYFKLSPEQRAEVDEICDRYNEGRFGNYGLQKIAERLTKEFKVKFTRGILSGICERRREEQVQ